MTKTNDRRRTLCLVAAALIFAWFLVAVRLWLAGYESVGAGVADTLRTLTSNWVVLVILSDAFLFIVLVFAWVLGDARARGWGGLKGWAWVFAMMAVGCPALLVYLALRPEKIDRPRD
jgi:hypothetical protein